MRKNIFGWAAGTAKGAWNKVFGNSAREDAINAAVGSGMSRDQASVIFSGVGKDSLTSKVIKGGALLGAADILIQGKEGIVGGAANKVWTDAGRIEAEQNVAGKWHSLFMNFKFLLELFGVKSGKIHDWVEEKLVDTGKKDSMAADITDHVQQNPGQTATLAGAGVAGLLALPFLKNLSGKVSGMFFGGGGPSSPGGMSGGNGPTGPGGNGGGSGKTFRFDAGDVVDAEYEDVTDKKPSGPASAAAHAADDAPHARGKAGRLMALGGLAIGGGAVLSQTFASSAEAGTPAGETLTADNVNEAPKGFWGKAADLAGEFGHKAHVLGHGVQSGLVGLGGSLEDAYDMVDGLASGYLPGDDKKNSTAQFLANATDKYVISKPEIRGAWDEAIHGTGEVATWLIPVGAAAKGLGAGARTVTALRTMEQAENVVGVNSIAQGAANFVLRPQ